VLVANNCGAGRPSPASRVPGPFGPGLRTVHKVQEENAWRSNPTVSQPQFGPAGVTQVASGARPVAIDPLYLFARYVEWELRTEPDSAWELLSAAQSSDANTRAHARSLLSSSKQIATGGVSGRAPSGTATRRYLDGETRMKTPYGLAIIDSCMDCKMRQPGFFCAFSREVLSTLDVSSRHSVLPAGAVLFVEGQTPRGIFILCSGRVKLSTTSKEGKVLMLKLAEGGEALGLSAAISGSAYQMTAETATPCQVNFVDRKDLLKLLQDQSEVGMRAAQILSFEFQEAYRDIQDLVLSRSSTGKLARLLLSCSPAQISQLPESRLRSTMTHEEMAQRIGSSRETVTRLLSDMKKRELIRLEGATLVIRNRTALEALAV
jgi:CRP/FNR family transcriptional regulator, cyclic AMP receptor protein